jgi:nucleoside-diphosphate-sugar epimerase
MVLVTGGTGLLGSHLLVRLAQDGQKVRVLFRSTQKIERVRKVFDYYFSEKSAANFDLLEWVEGDLLDLVDLTNAFKDITTVYHCAGFVSFAQRDFTKLMKINREGTANVVNFCLKFNVQKLVYVSSTAAIGGDEGAIITEQTKWVQSPDTSPYSISKYSAEKEVWRGIEEGLTAVIVNPSVIFGAGNWDESSLTILRTVANGFPFYTNGSNAFVDARDVAEIMVQLMKSDYVNERYLCLGESISFKELMTMIALKLHKKPPHINTPKWMMGLTWRIASFVSLFTGKSPAITKNSAKTAFGKKVYSNENIKSALNFQFRSLDDTLDNAIKGRIY